MGRSFFCSEFDTFVLKGEIERIHKILNSYFNLSPIFGLQEINHLLQLVVASASLPRFVSGSELAYLLAIGGLLLFL
jgi:hypothetical protein